MLETDDADDDYFTPASNATLANIFQNQVKAHESDDNSLKYVAPKSNISEEEVKSECIFACAVNGFEWYNNVYTERGKLGFAIVRSKKTCLHTIFLYNTGKLTLSCTNITDQLQVKVKESLYISYYDNSHKYWSLCCSANDMIKILEILNQLNVSIDRNDQSFKENEPPKPINQQICDSEEENDSDVSAERDKKTSIISRMANMGHSILPHIPVKSERSSDSSEASETLSFKNTVLGKKTKRKLSDNRLHLAETSMKEIESALRLNSPNALSKQEEDIETISTYNSKIQFCPISSGTVNTDFMNVMAEQRMNNNEIRMNFLRLSDKVEQVFNKLIEIESKPNTSSNNMAFNVTTELYQKLLSEYERKIKKYEEKFKSSNFKPGAVDVSVDEADIISKESDSRNEIEKNKSLSQDLEKNEALVSTLQSEVKNLKIDLRQSREENRILSEEISLLKQSSQNKSALKTNASIHSTEENTKLDYVVKSIMNKTFENVSEQFEDNTEYAGIFIKKIFGSIIRKVTLDILDDKPE